MISVLSHKLLLTRQFLVGFTDGLSPLAEEEKIDGRSHSSRTGNRLSLGRATGEE